MGVTLSGSSLGGVIFPLLLDRLFNEVGFAWGVRIAAFLILGCLIIANMLVRSRLGAPGLSGGRKVFDFEAFRDPVYCFAVVRFHHGNSITQSGWCNVVFLGYFYAVHFPYSVWNIIWHGHRSSV